MEALRRWANELGLTAVSGTNVAPGQVGGEAPGMAASALGSAAMVRDPTAATRAETFAP